jgi:hypothetical protein
MRTASLTPRFQWSGPFATVLLDVNQDSENARHEHQLRTRAACQSLAEQGADQQVLAVVSERLAETVHRPAPVSRLVVATRDGVVLDEMAGFRRDQPVATWGPLRTQNAEQVADEAVKAVRAGHHLVHRLTDVRPSGGSS